MSRGARFSAPVLKPEVAETIAKWNPLSKTMPTDQRSRNVVLPVVRELAAVAEPPTPESARTILRNLARFMVWADRNRGSIAPGVINPRNASEFMEDVGKDESLGWLASARTSLQRVGRAVNPAAWSAKLQKASTPGYSLPYDDADEELILLACRLPGVKNPAARLWSVAGPLGAGLRSHEATAARVGDIHERGGRLIVAVRGDQPRLVPIRDMWTDPVREAVAFVQARPRRSSQKFIIPDLPKTAALTARKLPWGGEEAVSLFRTRATWLTAHLKAGTPLPELRVLAGSLAQGVLSHLLSLLERSVTPEEAVAAGLRA